MVRIGKLRDARGLTLFETMIAITIGIATLAGGVVLYGQMRKSAGNAAAYKKVMALQTVIEEAAATSSGPGGSMVYPDLPTLRGLWLSKHADAKLSPWGGNNSPATDPGGTYAGQSTNGIMGNSSDTSAGGIINGGVNYVNPGEVDIGILYYYRVPGQLAKLTMWDNAVNAQVSASQYGIAICDQNGSQFYFVRGHFTGPNVVQGIVSPY